MKKEETLDELIERMEMECKNESKNRYGSSSSSSQYGYIGYYQRNDDSRDDDDER